MRQRRTIKKQIKDTYRIENAKLIKNTIPNGDVDARVSVYRY